MYLRFTPSAQILAMGLASSTIHGSFSSFFMNKLRGLMAPNMPPMAPLKRAETHPFRVGQQKQYVRSRSSNTGCFVMAHYLHFCNRDMFCNVAMLADPPFGNDGQSWQD